MRKLASIQQISGVTPIKDADNIELVRVLGWQCVAKKGEFKEGDLCVYFEIDSFLPVRPEFEFLRASSYKNSELLGEGFRLRTMKFRGEISQGLVLPVSIVEKNGQHGLPVGTDVTELLGVRKWEIPEMATTGGTVIGTLPCDVPHTDEVRIQTAPGLINEFSGLEFYISTKMDGSSHSVSVDANGFHVTGHNYEYLDDGKSDFYNFVKAKGLETAMKDYMHKKGLTTMTIQGEFCAPGIQKNRLRLTEPEWYVFTVRMNGKRVGLDDMLDVCRQLSLVHVPVEERGTDLPSKYPDVDALLKRAEGQYPKGGAKEGIVIRPVIPVFSKVIQESLSMKIINNRYLLKND